MSKSGDKCATRQDMRDAALKAIHAPRCDADCELHKPNGLCSCGNAGPRIRARPRFRRLVTPEVVLGLLESP